VSETCGVHKWCCDGVEHPILIDSLSVKLGPKEFNAEEIVLLKTKNGVNTETTYEIFEEIDENTKKCDVYTIGSKSIL